MKQLTRNKATNPSVISMDLKTVKEKKQQEIKAEECSNRERICKPRQVKKAFLQ